MTQQSTPSEPRSLAAVAAGKYWHRGSHRAQQQDAVGLVAARTGVRCSRCAAGQRARGTLPTAYWPRLRRQARRRAAESAIQGLSHV